MRAGPDGRAAPRIIGRYALYGEIASGGMATVHFGRQLEGDRGTRTVAVKRAHPHLAREPDFALMFLDEARLASRIHHPNVVETLDVLAVPPDLLLVMEYVHGESLWRIVRAARDRGAGVPAPIAAAVVVDMLRGLHAAHEAIDERGAPLGIVHRDVSPQNLLVGADGVARLVDFGIAKAAGRLHSTRDSSVKGKYGYMAPEQVRGEPVSRLADTYAAGIVLWELLTGERLFAGKTEAETIHRCLVGRVHPPSRFAPGLPANVDAVVRKALSRDPAQRYATADEMAADVRSCFAPVEREEIAAWMRGLVGDALAERARTVAEIERDAPTAASAPAGRRGGATAAGLLLVAVAAAGGGVLVFSHRATTSGSTPATAAAATASTVAVAPVQSQPVAPASTEASAVASGRTRPSSSAPPPRTGTRPAATARPSRAKAAACDPPYSVDAEGRQIFKPECM